VDVNETNRRLLAGNGDLRDALPHLAELARQAHQFRFSFGLDELPEEPGFIAVRGARQYGKSTWLESQIQDTVDRHGPGTALYLNGDEIGSSTRLAETIRGLVPLFRPGAHVRRLFIDEVTAVRDWERALKSLIDAGELRKVLVVTTGSRAADLRRGTERLPGRKGRLARSSFLFTPVPYREFKRVCGGRLGADTVLAYQMSGGSPVACSELAERRRVPEFVIEATRDWVYGECAASGRQRSALAAVLEQLHRHGGTPLGQAKLAREAGLANNTVAAGYIELLADLMCVGVSHSWDPSRRVAVRRRPAKFPFINLLAALVWDPDRPRSIDDFRARPAAAHGRYGEWLVAQELWRRAALRGDEVPEELAYWQGGEHELDFVLAASSYLEVKAGKGAPLEFSWFTRILPGSRLTVITTTPFATEHVRGVTLEQFLLGEHH